MTESFKHEQTAAQSRSALRESVIFPLVESATGGIAEVVASTRGGSPTIRRFDGAEAYRAWWSCDDVPGDAGDTAEEVTFAVWLFGPEREAEPSRVYRALSDALAPGGVLVVATETPWPGKILSPGELGEYTAEEIVASLTRSGMTDVETLFEGPFFRITRAVKSRSDAYAALIEAEKYIDSGDPAAAEVALAGITAQLESASMVREYALLIAACHDLAGRPEQALEALSEALLLDPRCARAMCGLGRIAALKGDLDTARTFFESALRCEPALVAALHGMAVIEEAAGDLEAAFRTMVTASDLRPNNDALMSEAARLGNATGAMHEVTRFVTHRLGAPPLVPERRSPPTEPLTAPLSHT